MTQHPAQHFATLFNNYYVAIMGHLGIMIPNGSGNIKKRRDDMNTGERIRRRRNEVGVSADALAEKIGVAKTTIYRYENGTIDKIPAFTISKIAFHLGTTPDYLLGKTDDPEIDRETFTRGYSPYMLIDSADYSDIIDKVANMVKAIQKNPKLALLFDKTGKLSSWQLDIMLDMADSVARERDDT